MPKSRILVIDDEAAIRDSLKMTLEYEGYEFIGAATGQEGLALAEREAPDLPLYVAGQPGWGGVDLDATAASLGLAPDRVRALGRLADDDLAAVLETAVAVVAPSRAEGFGLPVAEAMALGVPVVCSDAPALVEVTGGAALTVPVDDVLALAEALGAVAGDAALRARLSRLGRERAASMTWRAAAEATWAVYAEVV